jgi:hypothetical protein
LATLTPIPEDAPATTATRSVNVMVGLLGPRLLDRIRNQHTELIEGIGVVSRSTAARAPRRNSDLSC